MKKSILLAKMSCYQFMIYTFWQLFLLITILCWSTPSKAQYKYDTSVPPGTLEEASIYGWMGSAGYEKSYPGLGWRGYHYWEGLTTYDGIVRLDRRGEYLGYPYPQPKAIYEYGYVDVTAILEGDVGYLRGWGVIDYVYSLRKKHPLAPDYLKVPVNIHYILHAQVLAPSIPSAEYEVYAGIFFYGGDAFPWIPTARVRLTHEDQTKNFEQIEDSYSALHYPDETWNIRLVARVYIGHAGDYDHNIYRMSGRAVADPIITIDPAFTVEIAGVQYSGNELYEVVVSKNLYPKAIPAIPLLLLDE